MFFTWSSRHQIVATASCTSPKLSEDDFGKFPLAPMGAPAPVSAHARPSTQAPIDTIDNFSVPVSVGGGMLKFFDQLLPLFQAILSTFRFFPEKKP